MQSQLAAEQSRIQERQHKLTLGQTLRDRRMLTLAVIYLTIVSASYGITFFLPLIIKALGLSDVATGLVASIPYFRNSQRPALNPRQFGRRSVGCEGTPPVWRY